MKSDENEILERNVESLLGHSYDPPRIASAARDRIRANLVAGAVPKAPARPRSRVMWGGAALIAAAASVVAVVQLRGDGRNAAAVAQDGDRMTLGDGTVAVLDHDATVTPVGDRHVKVSGRVYLDVAPVADHRHFVVDTAAGTLTVLGTRFVVDAAADTTTTAVVRGQVDQRSGGADTLLHAGQQGVMRAGVAPTRAAAPRLSSLVGWARQARAHDDGPAPRRRSGTLYARQPNMPWVEDAPLPVTSIGVDVVVENQVARVAIDQTFHNPNPSPLEGVYRFTVPPDAALSRLAMYVDGKLEESAVVERMAARRIYEDLVYRRIDPALAEWTGAGQVELRVYPVPAEGDKRMIVAYTQPLPRVYDDWTLTVPMPDLDDPVGDLSIKVRIADCATCEIASPSHDVTVSRDGDASLVTVHQAGAKVGDSLVLRVRDRGHDARVATAREGDWQYALVRARPDLGTPAASDYRPRKWVILDDVSASRDAQARRAQADLIDHLLDKIDEDDQVAISTFDVAVRRHGDFVRAADVDRKAVRAFLDGERGGVGATDLGAGLDDAASQLAGTDPRDATVVYLGDGVATGGLRDLGQLRARIAGKATFIGFAVGDGGDVAGLGELADATGGLVVPIDPADDLDQRALDAISELYAPRITGVTAHVLDPSGAELTGATAYLRSGGLAEGDEAEVAVRAPAGATIAAVELDGKLGGQPWKSRIDVASATRLAHAGYAPRLWAQRHIQALVLARNTVPPPQPCSSADLARCPTVEQQRIDYRENLRKEIVGLGKQYFLLSPHTSLLVLENDAMYAQYGVTKGKNDGWAPYAVPPTIPVAPATTTGTIASGDDDLLLVRSAPAPFYSYDGALRNSWDGEESGVLGAQAGPMQVVTRSAGFGRNGAGFGGGGSADLDANKERLFRGDTGDVAGNGEPVDNMPVSVTKTADDPAAGAPPTTVTIPPAELDQPDTTARDKDVDAPVVTTGAFADRKSTWMVGGAKGKSAGEDYFDGHMATHGWVDEDRRYAPQGGAPYPTMWNFAGDYRLDDLTAFVPGFLAGPLDDAIGDLRDAAGGAKGSVDDAARALLAAARTALPAGVYRWGDGPDVTVDAAGAMSWQTTRDTGLVEVARFDGGVLRLRYDELGLELDRTLGDGSPALYSTLLPIAIADPDQLAHWFAITAPDDHTVALAPAHAPAAPTILLGFDADHHLVSIRTGSGRDLCTVRWERGAPVSATLGASSITIAYRTGAAPAAAPAPADLVTVSMPMHTPAYWKNKMPSLATGTDEWRRAMRELMAADAATGDASDQIAALRQLGDSGGLSLGDLVLGSAGLDRATSDSELVELLSRAGDAGRTVGRYLSASRAYGKHPRDGLFAAVAGDGLVGTLARHREILALAADRKIDRALTLLRAQPAGELQVIAAASLAQYGYQSPRALDAWDVIATGPWSNLARYEAARGRYNRGDYAGAATRFVELLTSPDPSAYPVNIDYYAQSAVTQSVRGQVGWELAWSAYRNAILDRGDQTAVMTLLTSAMSVAPDDIDRILGRAADLAAGDPDTLAAIVSSALQMGQVDRAAPLLDSALAKSPTPDLYRLASAVAERQGRVAAAADDLDHALALVADQSAPLSQVKADLSHLLTLRGRLALLATGADREHALDAALDVASRWREVDPDDDAVDRQIGDILLAGGRRDEAWRQLSTAIERHPMEGDGWALVADVMEKEGRLDDALTYWQQAIVIDQTNPTWIQRKAQTLFALGRDDEAHGLLEQIVHQRWHERWAGVVYQVRAVLAQADAQRGTHDR